jgi:DNA-binding NtrC family response regulator
VEGGSFREDLYHRLLLLHVELPPLRQRGHDIVALARRLLERIARKHRLKGLSISSLGESRLLAQPWRGNARELAHEIEREVIFARGPELDFDGLAEKPAAAPTEWRNPLWTVPGEGFSIDSIVTDLIDEVLRETDHNISATARRLGVTREFLRYRLGAAKTPKP